MQSEKGKLSLDRNIRVLILISRRAIRRPSPKVATLLAAIPAPSSLGPQTTFLLKLAPSLHGDLGAVEFTLVLNTSLLRLLTRSLSSISPREVVKFPECVGRKDKIPEWEREQVDQHPNDV